MPHSCSRPWQAAAWAGIEITFFTSYSALLFDTTPRSLSRQTIGSRQGSQPACLRLTGIIGVPPPQGSLAAALIAWSPAKGAVTGRKYHDRLFRSLRDALPQAIFRTDLTRSAPLMSSYWQNTRNPAGGLRVSFCAAFRFRAEQLTYRNRWICNFQGTTGTEKIPFTSIKEKVKGSTTSKVNI